MDGLLHLSRETDGDSILWVCALINHSLRSKVRYKSGLYREPSKAKKKRFRDSRCNVSQEASKGDRTANVYWLQREISAVDGDFRPSNE